MSNPETYRQRALEFECAADHAQQRGERDELLELASMYRAVADDMDAQEADMIHRGSPGQPVVAPRAVRSELLATVWRRLCAVVARPRANLVWPDNRNATRRAG